VKLTAYSTALGAILAMASGSTAAAARTSKSSTAATANGTNGRATGTTMIAADGIATTTVSATETMIGIVTKIVTGNGIESEIEIEIAKTIATAMTVHQFNS